MIIGTLFYAPLLPFIVGVFLPDIVDKGLELLGFLDCGRVLGHSVFFALGVGAVLFAATKRKGLALAVMFGMLLHLVQDSAYPVPYFYPIIQYHFACGLTNLIPSDLNVALEVAGLALIFVWWRWRAKLFYLRERILKTGRLSHVVGWSGREVRVEKGRDKEKHRRLQKGLRGKR